MINPTSLKAVCLAAACLLATFAAWVPFADAQHGATSDATVETFLVEGLRVDATDPPPGSAVGRAGARMPDGGYLHVTYGKPYKRGRQIFGGLVGFGHVWVTGAHRATELVVTVPVTVGGQSLEPGVYSLFTTPQPEQWTLHLNQALGMHLADEYDPALDVLTVDLTPTTLDAPVEALTIDFAPAENGADLRIRWDRTAITVPIRLQE